MKYPKGITATERAALQKVFLLPAMQKSHWGWEWGRTGRGISDLFHLLPSLGSFCITASFELQLVPKGIIY